jgi:photosystem II stability/assembly factor-like uncharacterized protein
MKNLTLLTFLIVFIMVTSAKGQWEMLNKGMGLETRTIDFVNKNVGWITGYGTLMKTEDGGETWFSLNVSLNICDVDFVNESIGWSYIIYYDEIESTVKSSIIKSTNGGQTWLIQQDLAIDYDRLYAVNDSIVYVIGNHYNQEFESSEGRIWKTSDGGTSWKNISPNLVNIHLKSIWFMNSEVGVITGSYEYDEYEDLIYGFILKTVDGGSTWEEKIIPEFSEIYHLQFLDDSGGYFLATKLNVEYEEFYLCLTADIFDSWEVKLQNTDGIQSFYSLEDKTIFAVMADSLSANVMKSKDGGLTWEKKQTLLGWAVKGIVHFIAPGVGLIFEIPWRADATNLYKSVDHGDSWMMKKFGEHLIDVCFINKNDGFAGAGHIAGGRGHSEPIGNLFVTNNGGETWHHSVGHPTGYVSSSLFLNDHIGFTVAKDHRWRGYIYKTVDNGKNWMVVYEDKYDSNGYDFNGTDICFMNEKIGWAIGSGHWNGDSSGAIILGTSDSGDNWDLVWKYLGTEEYNYKLNSIHTAGTTAWAVGECGMIVRYTEQDKWQPKFEVTDLPLLDVFFIDENHGWISGGYIDEDNINLKLFKTDNAGISWQLLSENKYQINDMFFEDSLYGWAVGNDTSYNGFRWAKSNSGIILETIDGGESWTVKVKDIIAPLNAIYFKDGYGWVVGDFGLVLRTDNGATWVDQSTGKTYPDKFSLSQNHPNPFNPSTTFGFSLPKPETVKIEVYNIIGQKIQTLLNKPMPAGYHEVEFNGQNLSSGVYIYKIEAGDFQDVKKMILLK